MSARVCRSRKDVCSCLGASALPQSRADKFLFGWRPGGGGVQWWVIDFSGCGSGQWKITVFEQTSAQIEPTFLVCSHLLSFCVAVWISARADAGQTLSRPKRLSGPNSPSLKSALPEQMPSSAQVCMEQTNVCPRAKQALRCTKFIICA